MGLGKACFVAAGWHLDYRRNQRVLPTPDLDSETGEAHRRAGSR